MTKLAELRLLPGNLLNAGRQPVVTGVPFVKGEHFDESSLQLVDVEGFAVLAFFKTASRWPDGSIKWVHLFFQTGLKFTSSERLFVCDRDEELAYAFERKQEGGILVETSAENVSFDTGVAVFQVKKGSASLFSQVKVNGVDHLADGESNLIMKDRGGEGLKTTIASFDLGDSSNPMQRTLLINGAFTGSKNQLLVETTLAITFYKGLATVKIDYAVRNPSAAEHPKGKWDLGDKGSVSFSELTQEIRFPEIGNELSLQVKHKTDEEWDSLDSSHYLLYQDSSGGENWKSYNHVNSDGKIPVSYRGYKCFDDGAEVDSGQRADPSFRISSPSSNCSVWISDFWQNFPKAIEVEQHVIRLKMFPAEFNDLFELQGGEQKTHTFYLDFSNDDQALDWCCSPCYIQLSPEYLANTGLMHFLPQRYRNDALQNLIDAGLVGDHNFFEKREVIDEYGWRNYGDIYADHEELEYRESIPLISHYNNQYDALDGLLRQYIVSGDRRWFDLAEPLARHVVDIDIYNTTEDKDEYNGGLFWHTDHYSNAYTCTHRTYSIKNSTSYDGEVGGGPGTEHCYTAGLANFFFLTGDPVYKDAALGLVQWIKRSFEGSGTVLERIFKFVTRDISIIKQLVSGRVVQKYKYPFTRATGNYLSSLLDGYQLTDDPDYIERAEKVIKQSIHPNDDISLRRLDDIELRWSYLIFLQAICKYLAIKSANAETDNAYCYARDSLLHYANWIMVNERPFLENSDQLDFPNLTWVAQDLRKAYVLRIASCFRTQNQDGMRSAAKFFSKYVVQQLEGADTSHYTRILVILMQNYLPDDSVIVDSIDCHIDPSSPIDYGQAPDYRLGTVLLDFVTDLFKCLRHFSLSSEIRWLKFRIKIF